MKNTIDLGVSGEGKYYGMTSDSNDYKKKFYPSFHVRGIKLPELPNEFYATVKLCKKTETIDYDESDGDDSSSCSFEVKEMSVEPQASKSGEKTSKKPVEEVFIAMINEAMSEKDED